MLLVVKLNPSSADSPVLRRVSANMPRERSNQSVTWTGHVPSILRPPHQHHLPTPPTSLGITDMPLTFLLDFIRQIRTVHQTIAREHLPENGENSRGDLPPGSVGIGEKNRADSLEPSSPPIHPLSSWSQQQISMSHN